MDKEKIKNGTKVGCWIIVIIALLAVFLSSYRPENLSNQTIIEEVALDECTSKNDPTLTNQRTLFQTSPGSNAGSQSRPSCAKAPLDVYKVQDFEGEQWLLIRVSEPFNKGDEQGWVRRSSVIPRD